MASVQGQEAKGQKGHLGKRVLRREDAALLTGNGRYADDLPVPPGTLQAYVLRSPHAHAIIKSINTAAALELDGVAAVITGEEIANISDPFRRGKRANPAMVARR